MSETYLFFNSTETDERLYSAEDFARVFSTVLSDGLIYKDGKPNLKVSSGEGLSVIVEAGEAILKGHPYYHHDNKTLVHENADEVFNRIDRIVLRFDGREESRYIKLFISKGTPSTSPKAPTLTKDDEVFELSLAQVLIRSNTTSINPTDITDERLKADACGLTESLVTIPYDEMKANFNLFKNQMVEQYNDLIGELGGQADPIKFQKELLLTKLNQLNIFMERNLENKSESMGEGFFFDTLKNSQKVDLENTTAITNNETKLVQMNKQDLQNEVVWKPHSIGFVSNKITHFHTRPVNKLAKVLSDALAGQDEIVVPTCKITVMEVNI